MLHLKKVLGAKPKEHVEAELATLFTPWGEALDIRTFVVSRAERRVELHVHQQRPRT